VPDSFDYAWLGELLAHPERWTDEELSTVRLMIADQQRAIESVHPKDFKGRRSARALANELEAALQAHLAQR
jgi:hypothetical protein